MAGNYSAIYRRYHQTTDKYIVAGAAEPTGNGNGAAVMAWRASLILSFVRRHIDGNLQIYIVTLHFEKLLITYLFKLMVVARALTMAGSPVCSALIYIEHFN